MIRYLGDRSREKIYEIELTDKTAGTKKVFKLDEAAPKGSQWRTMDCVDCHNRPSHNYRTPEYEVDLAITEGRIDRSLPFIKREGVRILTEKEYPSHEAARDGISAAVEQFYATNYPALAKSPAVEKAGKALGDAYCWNNFPHMRVVWNTYPNHIGHQQSPGCFRCHDNKHKTDTARRFPRSAAPATTSSPRTNRDSSVLQELGLQEAPPAAEEAAPATAEATTASATPAASTTS